MQDIAGTSGLILGMDESNHGRFDEVFVAASTDNLEDIVKTKYGKKKKLREDEVYDFLREMDFRYALIGEETHKGFGADAVKFMVASEFLEHFGDAEKFYIDGKMSDYYRRFLREYNKGTKFIVRPKADVTYPLVHWADGAARAIFNIFYRRFEKCDDVKKQRNSDRLIEMFSDNMIAVDPEKYRDILELARKSKGTMFSKKDYMERDLPKPAPSETVGAYAA